MGTQPPIHGLIPKVEGMDAEKTKQKQKHVYLGSFREWAKRNEMLWPRHSPTPDIHLPPFWLAPWGLFWPMGCKQNWCWSQDREESGWEMMHQVSSFVTTTRGTSCPGWCSYMMEAPPPDHVSIWPWNRISLHTCIRKLCSFHDLETKVALSDYDLQFLCSYSMAWHQLD